MTRRVIVGLTAVGIMWGASGCGESKPTIPTQLIEPPGPDSEGGSSGKKKNKSAGVTDGSKESSSSEK